jgi:hypothetical protein
MFLMLPDYNAMIYNADGSPNDACKDWQKNAATYQRESTLQNPTLGFPISTELGIILVVRTYARQA